MFTHTNTTNVRRLAGLAPLVLAALAAPPARAVPSFSGQTGLACTACHVGGFGPQLTPLGRTFKLEGYTAKGGTGFASKLPISAMILASYTNTDRNQPYPASEHYGANGNFAVDQISVFLAGRVSDHVGGFVQTTFDGIASQSFIDNVDLRVAGTANLFGRPSDVGLSFNNSPGLSDPYNSTYPWGYPFVGSALAPGANAGTLLGGSLAGNSLGLNAYVFAGQHLYLDLGAYDTMAPGLMKFIGQSYGPGSSTGIAPYARAAWEQDWGNSNAHAGVSVFYARFNPAYDVRSADGSMGHDKFTDTQFDAGYQYLADPNSATLDLRYTHEDQTLGGTLPDAADNRLNEFRATATYYYQNTYGATVSWDSLSGNKNQALYNTGADDATGSIAGSPNTDAITLEADYVPFGKDGSLWAPFANLKLGVQYTIYTRFNGHATNYDGFGRDAADNNTLYLFAWTIF